MFQYDKRFWKALQVTFTFVIISVPAKLIFALAVAMILDKGVRAIGWYRALFYLPSILGGSIAVAVLWRQLFENDGRHQHAPRPISASTAPTGSPIRAIR